MAAARSKNIAPAVNAAAPNANNEEFVRTRDAFITAITGLTSSLDKFAKAYLEHSEVVVENGGVLDLGPTLSPLTKLIPGLPGSLTVTPSYAITGPDALAVAEDLELDADGKKKKRKRNTKPRDPNAPKRPMTAYFRFMKEQRPALAEQLKNEPIAEDGTKYDINKLATERWKGLSDSEREQYAAAYRKDRQDYEIEMKALGHTVGKADMHDEEHAEDSAAAIAVVGGAADPVREPALTEEDSEEEESVPVVAPVAAPKSRAKSASSAAAAAAPDSAKKTPRQTKKKGAAAAAAKDADAVPTPQFSSVNPTKASAASGSDAPPSSSPARKRKAAKTETDSAPKKRGRKSNADKVAEAEADAAAASAQLELEQPETTAPKGKKDNKKKKRKSEAAE